MKLFLDIETIPGQEPELRERIAKDILPPGNIKKEDTIAKWYEEVKPGLVEKAWRDTALDPTHGEIICIGFAVDDKEPIMTYRELDDPEIKLLIVFYEKLADALRDPNLPKLFRRPIWIGHRITDFDLRFIWIRSVINRVHSPIKIPYNVKPWLDGVYDTHYEWVGMNRNISGSQDAIAKALGMRGKTDMDGSKVWDMVKAGKIEKVAEYCKDDVLQNRDIFHRMNFDPQPAD